MRHIPASPREPCRDFCTRERSRFTSHTLELSPAAAITWAHDIAGNAAASATFKAPADPLVIDSFAEPELEVEQRPGFDIAASGVDSRVASFVTSSD